MDLNSTTILTYADIRTISSGLQFMMFRETFACSGEGEYFSRYADKNAERYPVLWVYS